MSFAILDIDHFKGCNDSFGHHGADGILMELAARWTAELRPSDSLARFGGDEFAILFPRSTVTESVTVLERLRDAAPTGITFSAGVASWSRGEPPDALEGRADALLYQAKREGRDRIVRQGRRGTPQRSPERGRRRARHVVSDPCRRPKTLRNC